MDDCYSLVIERAKQYKFTNGLPKAYKAEAGKDVNLECFISDKSANVEWKLNGQPIKVIYTCNSVCNSR